nr:hypothetical protein [Pseudomonas tremae]
MANDSTHQILSICAFCFLPLPRRIEIVGGVTPAFDPARAGYVTRSHDSLVTEAETNSFNIFQRGAEMSKPRVLMQMWKPYREFLIQQHRFYVNEASTRLMSQFDNINADADKAAEAWLERRSEFFDPDRDDEGSIYEEAESVAIEFYRQLDEMREQTRLSIVSGMFHEWEKSLKKWIVDELRRWGLGPQTIRVVWWADFPKIIELLVSLGWPVQGQSYLAVLNQCRCVVNVFKHGDGKSLAELKRDFPKYLIDPIDTKFGLPATEIEWLNHSHLHVTEAQVQEFSNAITEFWNGIPENLYEKGGGELPAWFMRAVKQDLKASDG